VRAAAITHAACSVAIIGFQLALAMGAPLGRYAMGGVYSGALPPPMRVAEAVQAVVIAALACVVLALSGVTLHRWRAGARRVRWVPLVVATLALVLNLITPSREERLVWAPIALVLFVSSLTVGLLAAPRERPRSAA
jgi:hypothetical protein